MKPFFQTQTIRSATTEIISIVIGVLLALAVNEWNEDRINQQKAKQALHNIANELKSNIKLLNLIHNNNAAIITLLEQPTASTTTEKKSFIPGLQIQDTAWKTLISTGTSAHIDYDSLYMISEIYSIQQIYKTLGFQMLNNMMSTSALSAALNPDQNGNVNALFQDNMTILVQIETALLALYEEAIQNLTTK